MSKVTLEKSQEQYIVDAHGNKTAVILDIALYEQMLEDIHDLAVVAERRSQQSISLADMKKRLSLNGTLSN
jgi:PHD/YefM family antitoxin component YafN of YafNO toxin-antitoxin module